MKKIFSVFTILFGVLINSCDKEDDNVLGCIDENAENFNPDATTDDGSCIYQPSYILGCTDENAENFNPDATDDNGSCIYSISYLLNGEWNIQLLEYESELDLSQIDPSIIPEEFQLIWPVIVAGLGNVTLEGQAEDAGAFQIMNADNIYNQELVFETETSEIEVPMLGPQEIPSIPIDISSSGTWILQNNEQDIVFNDVSTGTQQIFEILTLTQDIARFKGNIEVPFDLQGFIALDIILELDLQMIRVNPL